MADAGGSQQAPAETDVAEFEDVALLLSHDQKQPEVKQKHWKDKLLYRLARGQQPDRTGFAKLEDEEDELEGLGHQKGESGFAVYSPRSVHGVSSWAPVAKEPWHKHKNQQT